MESKPILPQIAPWYDRLTTLQEGYYYPWRSQLPPNHGEDTYLDLVHEHLHPDIDVLDAACGHGAVALHPYRAAMPLRAGLRPHGTMD